MDFVRTIQQAENPDHVQSILASHQSYFPLPFYPQRAFLGDYLYLCWRGEIQGRARITDIRRRGQAVETRGG